MQLDRRDRAKVGRSRDLNVPSPNCPRWFSPHDRTRSSHGDEHEEANAGSVQPPGAVAWGGGLGGLGGLGGGCDTLDAWELGQDVVVAINASECAWPAAMPQAPGSTQTGEEVETRVPSPTWPCALYPLRARAASP